MHNTSFEIYFFRKKILEIEYLPWIEDISRVENSFDGFHEFNLSLANLEMKILFFCIADAVLS